jgi:hypothetical protein
MQFQVNLIGRPVEVAAEPETALGAAALAGLAVGVDRRLVRGTAPEQLADRGSVAPHGRSARSSGCRRALLENHRLRIIRKISASSRADLVAYALEEGLVEAKGRRLAFPEAVHVLGRCATDERSGSAQCGGRSWPDECRPATELAQGECRATD